VRRVDNLTTLHCLEIWKPYSPENLWLATGAALHFTESESSANWGMRICASSNGRDSAHTYSHTVFCFVCFVSVAFNKTRII